MHYDLLIITNAPIPTHLFTNINFLVVGEEQILVSPYATNHKLTFDYLIFSNPQTVAKIDLLRDNTTIITNYYLQTSLSHIFAIGDCNQSSRLCHQQTIKSL